MNLEALIHLLRVHQVALRSTMWPDPHGPQTGPALYLDLADTQALIDELTRVQSELAAMRVTAAARTAGHAAAGV